MPLQFSKEFRDENLRGQIWSRMEKIRQENSIPDLVIHTSNEEQVNAHKIILASCLKIPLTGNQYDLDWTHRTKEAVDAVITYGYTGRILLTESNVEEIFNIATDLSLSMLCNWCVEFLFKRMSVASLPKAWRLSVTSSCRYLHDGCIEFMENNFTEVISTAFFAFLEFTTLTSLLNSPYLSLETEETRLEAIIRWIDENMDVRQAHIDALLNLVDWSQISETFDLDSHQMCENSRVCKNSQFREIVDKSIKLEKVRIYVIGQDPDEPRLDNVISFYIPSRRSQLVGRMPHRKSCGIAQIGGLIYLIGGVVTRPRGNRVEEDTYSVQVFNPTSRRIQPNASPMRERRSCMAVASSIVSFVVCGGCRHLNRNEWISLHSCELFVAARNEWISLPNMVEARREFSLAWLPTGLLVATGGFTQAFHISSSVEILRIPWDATENPFGVWRPVASMHVARIHHAATILQGKVLVVGGYNLFMSATEGYSRNLDSTEIFLPPQDSMDQGQWTLINPMRVSMEISSCILLCGHLFTFGYNNEVHCFKPTQSKISNSTSGKDDGHDDDDDEFSHWTWESIGKLDLLENNRGAVVISSNIYLTH